MYIHMYIYIYIYPHFCTMNIYFTINLNMYMYVYIHIYDIFQPRGYATCMVETFHKHRERYIDITINLDISHDRSIISTNSIICHQFS